MASVSPFRSNVPLREFEETEEGIYRSQVEKFVNELFFRLLDAERTRGMSYLSDVRASRINIPVGIVSHV